MKGESYLVCLSPHGGTQIYTEDKVRNNMDHSTRVCTMPSVLQSAMADGVRARLWEISKTDMIR